MKKILLLSLIFYIILPNIAKGGTALTGRILLQVEEKGQAWYVFPNDGKRYSLGRPSDAFNVMKKLSIGISDKDLAKIPVDSSTNDYIDKKFTQKNSGKIFLQVEKNGEAWYVEPVTQKRYFLGRPADAFQIMRAFGLGITNTDLEKILIGSLSTAVATPPTDPITAAENVLQLAATAIRAADIQKTLTCFAADMHKSIEYSMKNMEKENLLILANILSGSTLKSTTENKKTYFNEVYFQNEKHPVYFYAEKQPDGGWLITNL